MRTVAALLLVHVHALRACSAIMITDIRVAFGVRSANLNTGS